MREVWKPVNGYPKYMVSNLGRVFSGNKYTVMVGSDNGRGYKNVRLINKFGSKHFYIHRLVAIHFIDQPIGKDFVNHIDYDKSNNARSNLEWCTMSENMFHSGDRIRDAANKRRTNLRGATYHKGDRLWRPTMRINGKRIFFGGCTTAKEAYTVYYETFKEWNGYEPFKKELIDATNLPDAPPRERISKTPENIVRLAREMHAHSPTHFDVDWIAKCFNMPRLRAYRIVNFKTMESIR